MKKLVLILSMVTAFTFVNGQGRTVDLAVTNFTKPERIPNGGPIDYSFSVKNGGTDVMKVGDTVLFRFILNNQNAIGFFYNAIAKDIPVGDSLTISGKININIAITGGFKGSFCVDAFAWNPSADSIKLETVATMSDNRFCNSIQFGDWDAGVSSIASISALNVFPNPAKDQFYISYTTEKSSDVAIRLMDIAGREVAVPVKERQQAGTHIEQINTSNLAAGVYFYQIYMDGQTQTGKITIE
ncbi:MAG: T9SS type A sorting domain-containing protein [Bacteroidota bacterium]|nr:T9SS type A sorting domain-containing protein [Bacteroidota bacterium]